MRSQYLSLGFLVLASISGTFSVPLGLNHDEPAEGDDKQASNLANLKAAKDEANRQIGIMEKVIADPTNEKHAPLIKAAFGNDASLNLDTVKANIGKLKDGSVNVKLPAAPGSATVAYTQYNDAMVPQHIEFGKKFHSSALSTQAGTLIHEASHALADTGDYIKDGKILKGSNPEETDKTGYAGKSNPYKTVKSIEGDKIWTTMRDSTKDMHKNAESYAQFASLCANANLRRRDFHMYRRALADGDHRTAAHYLVRRQSCALPKKSAGAKNSAVTANAKKGKLATTAKALGRLSAGAKKSAVSPGTKKPTLTAEKPSSKLSNTPKSAKSSKLTKPSAGLKSKLPGRKGVASAQKPASKVAGVRKPTSKSSTGKRVASAKFGATKKLGADKKLSNVKPLSKGVGRASAKKPAGARTPGSKSPTKGASRTSSKKTAGARNPKTLTKGVSRAGVKKAAGARQPASKSLTKGAGRAGSGKVAGARAPKSATKGVTRAGSKKVAGAKSLTKGASRVGPKKVPGARTSTSKPSTKGANRPVAKKALSKVGGTQKSAVAGARKPSLKNTGVSKPTLKVAGKSTAKPPTKGVGGAKKVASGAAARKPTPKVASVTKASTGAKKAVPAKPASQKVLSSTVSGGKGASKNVVAPPPKKATVVASKAGKKK